MMTLNDARSQVARMNARFLECDLAVAVNPAIAFPSKGRIRLSWPSAKESVGMLADGVYASISEYRAFFYGNHYTCLLNDGALIQISFDFKNNNMVAHRLCLYPCPINVPKAVDVADWDAWNDLLEQELLNQIEALKPSKLEDSEGNVFPTSSLLRLRSPIRFDYDPERQSTSEPASHVHLNDAESRIPVHAALSLGQFVHFLISYFYPSYSEILDDFALSYYDKCIRMEEEKGLHINWRRET